MKKIVTFLALASVGILLTSCGAKQKEDTKTSDWDKIVEKGTMIIGVDEAFVPMSFRDEDNNLIGFDVDMAKATGEELGIEIEFQPIDWTMKEAELDNGTIDAIWNGYTVTEERKKKVAFSENYLMNDQIIVSMKASKINSFEDMKGKILGVQEGSSGADLIEDRPEVLKNFIKDNEPILFPTYTEAFMDLESGRIDGLLVARIYANYYISHQKNKNDYVVTGGGFDEDPVAVGFRKNDTKTVTKVNGALKKLYESGKSKEISEEWFGEDRIIPQ